MMVDKDFVAVEYATRMPVFVHIDNAHAMLSDGSCATCRRAVLHAGGDNLPAKTGRTPPPVISMTSASAWTGRTLLRGGDQRPAPVHCARLRESVGNHQKIKRGDSTPWRWQTSARPGETGT